MNEVVDWLRARGHVVLLNDDGAYSLDGQPVSAVDLLRLANFVRSLAGLEPFPHDLADPQRRGFRRQTGSLQLLINA